LEPGYEAEVREEGGRRLKNTYTYLPNIKMLGDPGLSSVPVNA